MADPAGCFLTQNAPCAPVLPIDSQGSSSESGTTSHRCKCLGCATDLASRRVNQSPKCACYRQTGRWPAGRMRSCSSRKAFGGLGRYTRCLAFPAPWSFCEPSTAISPRIDSVFQAFAAGIPLDDRSMLGMQSASNVLLTKSDAQIFFGNSSQWRLGATGLNVRRVAPGEPLP
jgi:hypothetical protein